PTTTTQASTTTSAARAAGGATGPAVAPKTTGLPDGSPYGPAVAFTSSVDVPTNLVWVLAIGSDARPGQDLRRTNGDSIHLIGVEGFQKIVDELGGVNVSVDKKMNDNFSGAHFQPGWYDMNGGEALAYSRDRHDVANGDFTRSLHQGNVFLSGLAKLRAEVGDDGGLQRWIGVLLRHADLDSPPQQLLGLAALARRLDPSKLTNVVVPGRVGTAGAA